jgi:putative membrane protein
VLIRLALRLLIVAAIIGLVAWIVPGINVHGGFGWYVWLAVIFSVVNLIIGTVLRLISLPLLVLTLGLFLIVIDAAVLAITAWLSSHLSIDSFGAALLGGLLVGVFSWVAELAMPARWRRRACR